VQLKRATRQVWQVPESAGLLLERHVVTQLSGCPMQLVPQLATCVEAVPSMTSVQSEQPSHPPPTVHRYCVLGVASGGAVHVAVGAASPGPPSEGAPDPPLGVAPLLQAARQAAQVTAAPTMRRVLPPLPLEDLIASFSHSGVEARRLAANMLPTPA
jgi:hypothetical protein